MIELIQGDCLRRMADYPDHHFSALISDPPYGTTALAFDQEALDWPEWWRQVRRVVKPTGVIALFAADLFTVDLILSNRKDYRYRLVWQKSRPSGFLDANRRPLRSHEDIVVFIPRMKGSTYRPQKTAATRRTASTLRVDSAEHYGSHSGRAWSDDGTRHPTSVLTFPSVNSKHALHPTEKPVELLRWLVRTYTNPGERILDPFAGSASGGAAAALEGREWTGIECDPSYYAIGSRRLKETA